jgi:2-methylisocitrate lyase-like PEP mutase family enzyme
MTEAGADVIFIEAPESMEELHAIAKLPAPQVVNIVIGGKTPMPSIEGLRGLGFAIVLYANAALQATIRAVQEVLGHLRRTGSLAEIEDRLVSFSERQRIVGKDAFDALEAHYAVREPTR